ncbi:MAG: hypothetical protein VX257_02190, partial [Planctomycetota bacterium]|nr:hypothetical protein [Planctomycetota bacterium]
WVISGPTLLAGVLVSIGLIRLVVRVARDGEIGDAMFRLVSSGVFLTFAVAPAVWAIFYAARVASFVRSIDDKEPKEPPLSTERRFWVMLGVLAVAMTSLMAYGFVIFALKFRV